MKTIITILFLAIISSTVNAQLDGYMKADETLMSISLNVVTLNNPALIYEDGQTFGPYLGPGLGLNHYNYDQWEFRWGMEFKWVTDIFPEIYKLWDASYDISQKFPMLTSLWATDLGTNVYSTEYFNIGFGAHFADYLVEIPDWNSTGNIDPQGRQLPVSYQEPTGWYWAAGPTMYLDAGYKEFFMTITTNYSFSYWRPDIRTKEYKDGINKIDGYKAPNFLDIDVTVNHDSGIFLSFSRTLMIDRGINSNKFSRNDLGIGWKF